jgi:hypothetical protein
MIICLARAAPPEFKVEEQAHPFGDILQLGERELSGSPTDTPGKLERYAFGNAMGQFYVLADDIEKGVEHMAGCGL